MKFTGSWGVGTLEEMQSKGHGLLRYWSCYIYSNLGGDSSGVLTYLSLSSTYYLHTYTQGDRFSFYKILKSTKNCKIFSPPLATSSLHLLDERCGALKDHVFRYSSPENWSLKKALKLHAVDHCSRVPFLHVQTPDTFNSGSSRIFEMEHPCLHSSYYCMPLSIELFTSLFLQAKQNDVEKEY